MVWLSKSLNEAGFDQYSRAGYQLVQTNCQFPNGCHHAGEDCISYRFTPWYMGIHACSIRKSPLLQTRLPENPESISPARGVTNGSADMHDERGHLGILAAAAVVIVISVRSAGFFLLWAHSN